MTKLSKVVLPFVVLGTAFVANAVAAAGNKCYAIALSSGQENAAYQAGVIKGLIEKLPTEEVQYTSVSGISGGSVNAALLAAYAKGDEASAADRMIKFWKDAANAKLYQNWWGGVIAGLFTAGGLYDNMPLYNFLTTEFTQHMKLQRELNIGITDVLSGQYGNFDELKLEDDQTMLDVLFASFAFPGFFPPADAMGSKWFDGSAVYDVDIFSAINKCMDNGFTEADIVVDVILTSSANLKEVDATDYKSIGMLFRYLEISSFYSSMDGLLRAKFSYPDAHFRYVVSPTTNLPSSKYPLNLNETQITQIIEQGLIDAQNAVDLGQGTTLDHLIHYHFMKTQSDERIADMTYGDFLQAKARGDYDLDEFSMKAIVDHPSYIEYQLKMQ